MPLELSARVYHGNYLLQYMPSTSARVYHGNAGWRSLPAIRKALGAVEGCSRGQMAGVSPALPETKARNGAQPLATRTNYKYHTTKVIICCSICHPLAQEFTIVMRAGAACPPYARR